MVLGREASLALGADVALADQIAADVRRRDAERLDLELSGGLYAGIDRLIGNVERRDAGAS